MSSADPQEPTREEIREAAAEAAQAQAVEAELGDTELGDAEFTTAGDSAEAEAVLRPPETTREAAVPEELPPHTPGAVEPGSEGPRGTGTEGADDVLARDAAPSAATEDAPTDDLSTVDEFSTEEVTAAEQGNRVGDEMISEGDDNAKAAQIAGDDLQVDAAADDGILPADTVDGLTLQTDELSAEE